MKKFLIYTRFLFSTYLETDAVKSGSNNGKLAYTFPGLQDIVTATNDQLKELDRIEFVLEVENDEGETLECANKHKCKVNFRWEQTPEWDFISPQVIYPGSLVTLKVNPKNAPN